MLIPCSKIQKIYESTENALFDMYGANSIHQRSTHHMGILRIFCYVCVKLICYSKGNKSNANAKNYAMYE